MAGGRRTEPSLFVAPLQEALLTLIGPGILLAAVVYSTAEDRPPREPVV
ncbi:hypothetical protein [Nonomuraea sp. NPDC050643]